MMREEVAHIVGSFTSNLRAFIFESSWYSIAACLAPLALIVPSKEFGRVQVTTKFFGGDGGSAVPPIMLQTNTTCVILTIRAPRARI